MAQVLLERSGEEAASLAARAMNGEVLTQEEVKTLAGSVLRHRRLEVKGHRRLLGIGLDYPEGPENPKMQLIWEGGAIDLRIDNRELVKLAKVFVEQLRQWCVRQDSTRA